MRCQADRFHTAIRTRVGLGQCLTRGLPALTCDTAVGVVAYEDHAVAVTPVAAITSSRSRSPAVIVVLATIGSLLLLPPFGLAPVKVNAVPPLVICFAVYTDELSSYRYLGRHYAHGVVRHSHSGSAHTNTIEGFWSLVKCSYVGVYHWWSVKYLHRYIGEHAARYNMRGFTAGVKLERMLRTGVVGDPRPPPPVTASSATASVASSSISTVARAVAAGVVTTKSRPGR